MTCDVNLKIQSINQQFHYDAYHLNNLLNKPGNSLLTEACKCQTVYPFNNTPCLYGNSTQHPIL